MAQRVCQDFLRGNCRYGDRCRYLHPPQNGPSGPSNRQPAVKYQFNEQSIQIELASELPKWILSSFGAAKYEPNLIFGYELSPEELRWKSVEALRANRGADYVREEETLLSQARTTIAQALSNLSTTNQLAQRLHDARFPNNDTSTPRPREFSETAVLKGSASAVVSGSGGFGNSIVSVPAGPRAGGFGGTATTSGASVFGSSGFGQKASASTGFGGAAAAGGSAFGSSAFGQNNTSTGAGSSFGQNSTPAGSAFGQSSFGAKPSAFGTAAGTSSAAPSAFRSTTAPNSAFGSTTNPGSAFGQSPAAKPALGGSTTVPAPGSGFGQSGFGQAAKPLSAFGQTPPNAPKSAFGTSPAAPAFGSSGFGSSNPGQTSAFGSSPTPAAFSAKPTTSAFGSTSTPAATAFGSTSGPATSAFGSTTPATSAFGSTTPATSAFGASAPAFGASSTPFAFGSSTTSAFGQPAKPAASAFGTTATPSTSAFGAPATSSPSAFGSTPATQTAFGSTPSAQPSNASSAFGQTTFGQPPKTSAFGSPPAANASSGFGGFGTPATQGQNTSSFANPFTASAFSSGPNSAFAQPSGSVFGARSTGTSFPPDVEVPPGWSYDDPWSWTLATVQGSEEWGKLEDEVVEKFKAQSFDIEEIPIVPPPPELRA